jgi:hypothetical protein
MDVQEAGSSSRPPRLAPYQEALLHQAPLYVRTEEVAGSIPVSPTRESARGAAAESAAEAAQRGFDVKLVHVFDAY